MAPNFQTDSAGPDIGPMTGSGTAPDIRKATAGDQPAIVALVRAERLNPNHLDWRNFIVATDEGGAIIGAAQIRPHRAGARELASLVVAPHWRGRGLAGRLVDVRLAEQGDNVCVVTGRQNVRHYARWGFRPISVRDAPTSVWRNCILGQIIGGAHAIVTRRPVNRLVVLSRKSNA